MKAGHCELIRNGTAVATVTKSITWVEAIIGNMFLTITCIDGRRRLDSRSCVIACYEKYEMKYVAPSVT